MPATSYDFIYLSEDPDVVYFKDQWPLIVRAVKSLLTVYREKVVTGVEPDDYLLGWYFSNGSDNRKYIRIQYNSGTGEFLISKNTATEAAPSWTDLFKINIASTSVTIPGNLTVSGTLTGGAHAASHLPGGSDALTTGVPSDIGSANAAGTAAAFARQDHVHRGISSVDVDSSGAVLHGAVNITSSGLADVSKSGQTITVDSRLNAVIDVNNDTGANQTITGLGALNNMGGLALTGANGVKNFYVNVNVSGQNTNGSTQIIRLFVYMGPLGTTGDTLLTRRPISVASTLTFSISLANFKITPANGDKLTIAMGSTSGLGDLTIHGANPEFATLTVFDKGNT